MYIAELQGKFSPREERMEDILTSNVFSFFKYAKREIFLYEFLKLLDIQVNPIDLSKAEFIFWPSYEDGTEPDLVIIVGDFYLLIEAKFCSGFGRETNSSTFQLIREYKQGQQEAHNFEKQFKLITVTAHYANHQFIAENPENSLIPISWINWHQIAILLHKILNMNQDLDNETRTFATDLYQLLLKKDLRKYAGQEVLGSIPLLTQPFNMLFFDTISAQYRGDFLGFQVSLKEFSRLHKVEKTIFYERKRLYFRCLPDIPFSYIPESIFLGGKQ